LTKRNSGWYNVGTIMNTVKKTSSKKAYTAKEVQQSLDKYLDTSSNRLRKRLRVAWRKQVPLRERVYGKFEI